MDNDESCHVTLGSILFSVHERILAIRIPNALRVLLPRMYSTLNSHDLTLNNMKIFTQQSLVSFTNIH